MNEKTTLCMLDAYHASIEKQNVFAVDGKDYPVGEPWRVTYDNSTYGRSVVESEVSEPYKTAIFSVWGDTPTVDDPSVD